MKKAILIVSVLIGHLVFAQSIEKFSIDSGGASVSTGTVQILYTIGEVHIGELTGTGVSISEGFINPQQLIIKIDPKIFLQGPYNINSGLMNDNLRSTGNIPSTSPYVDAISCSSSVFNITGNNAIIDWVWLELRDSGDAITVVSSRSALLQSDGDLVDTDGTSPLTVDVPAGNYYVVLAHRNHLGIRSANTISLTGGTHSIDLRGDSALIAGGANAVANLGDGNFALYLGDFDGNGQVQISDLQGMSQLIGISSYSFADFNMNGEVQNTDRNALFPNLGKGSQADRSAVDNVPIFFIIAPRQN